MKTRNYSLLAVSYVLIVIGGIIMLFPYYWMVISSLKSSKYAYATFSFIPESFDFSAYHNVFHRRAFPIINYFWNSIVITGTTVVIQVVSSVLAAYVLAQKKILGNRLFTMMIIGTLLIPVEILMIPIYFVTHSLHLLDTITGVSLSLAADPLIFLIFYRFFLDFPTEILDAAYIDGASEITTLSKVVLPIAKPVLSTAILLSFLLAWSAFITPWILSPNAKCYTLTVSIFTFSNEMEMQLQELMTVATLQTIPVLFIFVIANKRIWEGLTLGSVKG